MHLVRVNFEYVLLKTVKSIVQPWKDILYSTALKATDKFDLKALKSLKLVKTLAKLGKLKYQSHPDNWDLYPNWATRTEQGRNGARECRKWCKQRHDDLESELRHEQCQCKWWHLNYLYTAFLIQSYHRYVYMGTHTHTRTQRQWYPLLYSILPSFTLRLFALHCRCLHMAV